MLVRVFVMPICVCAMLVRVCVMPGCVRVIPVYVCAMLGRVGVKPVCVYRRPMEQPEGHMHFNLEMI